MGQFEILIKLQMELNKKIKSEAQVVYVLSRIRKFLELRNQKSKYKYLNFYCNWALHAKIDRTEVVVDILREVSSQGVEGINFITFEHLKTDLKAFFKDNKITKNILGDQWPNFQNLLVDIYSDTSLEFYPEDKQKLTIYRPEKIDKNSVFSVAYRIDKLSK